MKSTARQGIAGALSFIASMVLANSAMALTMTVLDYPYQPDGSPAGAGGGLSSLTFSGGAAYTITTDFYEPNQLYSIDPATGAGTQIAASGQDDHIGDLATQPGTGVVFGSYQGALVTIDTTTGAVVELPGVLPGGSNEPGGLAFAADGTLYYISAGNLYTLDPADGSTLTTTAVSNGQRYMGLGIQPGSGALYAASRSTQGAIYLIDPSTGAASFVENVSNIGCPGTCFLHDIDFEPGSGTMYGVMGGGNIQSGGSSNQLPGAFVRFGDLPTAAPPAAPVPVMPLSLLFMTAVALLAAARHRL